LKLLLMNRVSILLFWLLLTGATLIAADLPPGFVEEQIVTGLDPTAMAMAPDERIFLLEKSGRVLIIENGVLLPDPFVTLDVDNFNERGLGGMVFHPDFEQNNFVYFYYSVPGENRNRVSRVVANGNFAVPGSEEVIFDLDPMNGTIHNGGSMHFGPDGKLYVSVGDGADANAANDLNSLLGKILRLNDDGSIPEDNPFYDDLQGDNRAIYAYGLRNSFSTAMHPVTGQYFGCDVGGNLFEEVNEFTAGNYYGWPDLEGFRQNQNLPSNYKEPLHAYNHDVGCAVIAATFYSAETPTFPPQYHDKFFFADYCQGFVRVMDPATGEIEETFATNIDRPLSFMVAPNGDFYYLERSGMGGGSMQDNTSTTNGSLWRVRYTGSGAPFISVQPDDVFLPVGETANFSVQAVGMETLTFQWQRDGVDLAGENGPTLTVPNVQLSDDGAAFRCLIANAEGSIRTEVATLRVTANTRPVANLTLPLPGATYRAGDTIFFAGFGNDAEDGSVPNEGLRWFIDFHHNDHTHPALENLRGTDEGFFIVPRIGEVSDNVWYRVYLVVEDEGGLVQSPFREVFPEKADFTVRTSPSGLRVNVDGQGMDSPAQVTSVIGIRRTLSAPINQVRGDTLYRFQGWQGANDNLRLYSFLAGDQDEIIADYEALPLFIGNGTGLTADFFTGNNETDFLRRRPVASRIDPVVDFIWGGDGPLEAVGNDNFLVRWRGEILAPVTDEFTFYLTADDGVRLWVDDELIIDQWVPQPPTEASGTISLEGGRKYRIRLEYFEAGGGAQVQLEYSSRTIPRGIIPTTQLFPDPFTAVNEDFTYSVYPSPADQEVTLELGVWQQQSVSWVLYDASGRRCSNGETFLRSVGTTILTIPVEFLPQGLYYLRLEGRNGLEANIPIVKGK
jgi:glucose/arabinose dehydrogenase